MPDLELIWLLVPLAGLLSQIGGTWWKGARRFIVPLLLGASAWIFGGFSWLIIPMVIAQFAVFTMPFTLKGNGIKEHWFNWLWVPLWSVLLCSPPLILNYHVWPATLILGAILAILCILSNLKATERWFQWKLCEFMIGACPATVLCFAITLP